MRKYTNKEYADMAAKANELGKMLFVKNGELEINEPDFYECQENTNITNGTLNPDFGTDKIEDKKAQIKEELFQLDQKRIRAVCEPELQNPEEGKTWLEYYNFKIFELREQLAKL